MTARDRATIPNVGNRSTPPASATTNPEVVVGPVSAANSTVVALPTSILANGIATSTITVTLKDSNGVRISGEGVTLAGSPAGSTISPAGAQTTNASGQAAFTVKSTNIGPVVFTATSVTNSVVITQTVNIGFVNPATATAYNVNFLDEGQANATGQVGVVGSPGETWNQGTMSVSAILSTTGAVSSVNVSGLGDDGRIVPGPALSVFSGGRGFFNKGLDTTMSITGLAPNTAYDLYIYALGHNNTAWGNITDSERTAGDFVTTNTVIGNGQSNMVGYGSVETGNGSVAGAIGSLRYVAVNDASFPDHNYASLLTNPSNTASAFRTRSDVKVWWRNGASGNLGGSISKGDLGPPYQGAQTDKIGPEFAFGHVLGDFYAGTSEDVLIIKCAWGGRDLAEKFRPPSAVAKRGGVVGPFYNAIIEQTRELLNKLDTEFPAWSGRGYEIVGFAWHQGYNDRLSTQFSNEYKYNLPDLISDVRNVFNKPNLPFAIATTGMATGVGGTGGPVEASPYPNYTAVEKAQLWVSGVAQPANVLSTDTRRFWRDSSASPASQGHHWNWSAESYFLIGKSLGDNMVDLLTP